jgi:S-adenosylmethionine synthetase
VSRFFTSESVTEGHPDKIADQISDSVLDALLAEDPKSRVACETYVTTGLVLVGGEVTTEAYADIARIARDRVLEIGYDSSVKGFDGESCAVQITLDAQSPDIAQGVDTAFENRADGSVDPLDLQGAGDQGLMFGFAIDETPELMPLPITIAHRLAEQLTAVRKDGTLPYLRADGKTQVTIEYGDDDKPKRVEAIVVSTQHEEGIDLDAQLRGDIKKHVIDVVLGQYDIDSSDYKLHVNPTGRFVIGGPMGDVGLTGRKIIVDTYGGYASRSASTWTPTAPRRSRSTRSVRPSSRSSTSAPAPSSATSTCSARSTRRPPPTATSAAPACRGRTPAAPRPSRPPRTPDPHAATARHPPGWRAVVRPGLRPAAAVVWSVVVPLVARPVGR